MSGIEEIIHIIPLGYEVDRVVKPFEKLRANRVYLLTLLKGENYSQEMIDEQKHFLKIVTEKLKEKHIDVIPKEIDIFDMLDVMKNVSEIIQQEKQRKNLVYVNMSGAGRLTSVAATLAAMAHDAKAYYVAADRYSKTPEEEAQHGLSICEKLNITYIQNLPIVLPESIGLKVLVELCKNEKSMKKRDIIKFLWENNVEGFELKEDYTKLDRNDKQKYQTRLNKRILNKLEKTHYIERERKGRNTTIKITESGIYIAHVSGQL